MTWFFLIPFGVTAAIFWATCALRGDCAARSHA